MKKKGQWLTLVMALGLITVTSLSFYGVNKGYSGSSDGKVVWSAAEPGVVLAAAGKGKTPQTEEKEPQEKDSQTGVNQKTDGEKDKYDRNWLGHPAAQFVMPKDVTIFANTERNSADPKKEDLKPEEAAEIGLRWLYAVFGYDASGQTVEMFLQREGAYKRLWIGVIGELSDGYSFQLDSVTGKLEVLLTPGIFDEPEPDTKVFSVRDTNYMYDGAYWSKMIHRLMEQTGLSEGKTVNTVTIMKVRDGRIELSCILNEVSDAPEKIYISYDFLNQELSGYKNETANKTIKK